MKHNIFNQKILALVLTIVALMAGQTAWAENTWTVENLSGSTFTITRSGDLSKSETVRYRTVSLTAVAGEHFNNESGSLTFAANEDSKEITVREGTPSKEYYKYQTSSTRKYRFEVTDQGGFLLADCDRTITTGRMVTKYEEFLNKTKSASIASGPFIVTEDGYKQTGLPKTIASTAFYDAAQQGYIGTACELHMTLEFQAKEVNDGYQYLQIITDNITDCDSEKSADKGDPGTPSVSRYMAGFEICSGSMYDTYKTYSFPVTSVGHDKGATNPWGHDTDKEKFPLSKQKFKTGCRASDGTLLLPIDFQTLAVRFDASGEKEDDWYVKNLNAKITAVDTQAPTHLNAIVSDAPRSKGNTFYITLVFKEIVKITGTTKKLSTSWGDLTYIDGDGTNVLTFRGTISNNATNPLAINSLTGTVKDLAGNTYSNSSISHTNDGFNLTESFSYPISYDLNEGTATNPDSYTYETATFTLNNPTKEGNYYFAGWTGSNGDVPQKTVSINQFSHGALSYTAHWTLGYSVFFNSNGGTGTMSQQDFNIGETKALTANTFTRNYYIFTGWNTEADGSGTSYTNGQSVSNLAASGETVTLYAQWTPDYALWGADNDHDGTSADRAYIITTKDGLNLLADLVKKGNTFGPDDTHPEGYFFKLGNDITYKYTCTWNNDNSSVKENNYIIIGNETNPFNGTFDGNGKTLSGIRVYQALNSVGLFAYIGTSGKVKNLTLSDSRIYVSLHNNIGAIAGYNLGTIENCCLTDHVCIVSNGTNVGGIAGKNSYASDFSATIKDCTSSVTIRWGGKTKGGIVGQNYGKVVDCFSDGVQILERPYEVGAITGFSDKDNAQLIGNYYHNCSVNNSATTDMMTNVGVGTSDATSADKDGARGIAQITLAEAGIGIDPSAPVTFRNKSYYYSEDLITLSYSGTEDDIAYEVKKASDGSTLLKTSSIFVMPGYDITVSTANSLWEGAGTEQSPYLIKDENEFAQLIYKIHGYKGAKQNSYEGKYFRQNVNLIFKGGSNQSNLNDNGTTSRDFKGIYDGNGWYISGITVSPTGDTDHSIFGDLNGGTVKNLTIKNSAIRVTASGNEASDYAFVCRNLKAGAIDSVTVKNCTIDVQEGLTVNTMGAVCATLESGTIGGEQNAKGCTVDMLQFSADGFFSKHPIINTFGGICGKVTNGTVSYCACTNSTISLEDVFSHYTGGIVGEVAMNSRDNHGLPLVTITNCTFKNSNISNYQCAGGIVGKVDHYNCQISGCHTSNTVKNDGSITSYGSYAGGIVGWFNGDDINLKCEINVCYNDRKVFGADHVGGIAGYASNCYVYGCYNYSDIRSTDGYMGGIAGELTGHETSIVNCFNAGDINQNKSYNTPLNTGGIVGYLNGSNTNSTCFVAESFNSYKVHGYNRVGGIAGTVEGSAYLTFCYNTGVVKGIAQVGGLIGLQKNASQTSCCYSAGKVEGSSMVGAVCGYATTSANFSNCYYDNQMVAYKGVDDQDVANITSLTHANMLDYTNMYVSGLDSQKWSFESGHYPRLTICPVSGADKAATLVFPLTDSQNTTNLDVYDTVKGGDQITLPTENGLTWIVDHDTEHLTIDNNKLLYASMRGICDFNILNSDNRPLRTFEANFGISAQQPIEICDTASFRQFRYHINADQKFVYDESEKAFKPSGNGGVVIPQSAEGCYFKLNYTPKEGDTKNYFWMVQEEPHEIRWDPIGAFVNNHIPTSFKGKLDGNGHKIIFKCNRPDQDYVGLFGRMEGHIKNLKVGVSVQRDDAFVNGKRYVGAIAGFCNGTIENCSTVASDSSAFVPTVTGNDYVGALIGRAEFSRITGCDNAYCYVSGKTANVGYVVGSHDDNTIISDTTSTVTSTPHYQVALCDKDLEKPDGDKNPDRISALYAKTHSNTGDETSIVTLPGRILYKDGAWNTICLPFSLSAEQIAADNSPLKGISSLMELDTQGTYDGHKTGFDATTGTLYLFFKDVTSIEAGKPYIFKYNRADNYGPYDYKTRILHDVHSPEFRGVTIDNSETAQNRMTITSADGWVSFKSTYSYIPYYQTDKSVLFIGSSPDNPKNGEYYTYLYYPEVLTDGANPGLIGACRAYFKLNHGLAVGGGNYDVKAYRMNLDDNTDGVGEVQGSGFKVQGEDSWYDLSGRRLSVPSASSVRSGLPHGIYINNGRKVVIK
ncbi:MAG: InlB B-repeat-containing protein [Bacteroidaceae bacterium]|nr:InlB B-repeat-containing protein [Bacteroidaceae bacterium]